MQPELEAGVVANRVLVLYVAFARVLLLVAALVFVVVGAIALAFDELLDIPPVVLTAVLGLPASAFYTGLAVQLVQEAHVGRDEIGVGELLASIRPVLVPLLLVSLVTGLAISVGLALVVPGVILLTIWAVAVPVVVFEDAGWAESLTRSRELVRGYGWPVGVVITGFFLVSLAVNLGFTAVGGSFGTAGAVGMAVAASVLTAPLLGLAGSVLYFELAARERARGARR